MSETLRLLQSAVRLYLGCDCGATLRGCTLNVETPAEFAARAQRAGWTTRNVTALLVRILCPECGTGADKGAAC